MDIKKGSWYRKKNNIVFVNEVDENGLIIVDSYLINVDSYQRYSGLIWDNECFDGYEKMFEPPGSGRDKENKYRFKPNWDNAPEWAQYCAMDRDGIWYWFEKKPYADNNTNCWWSANVESPHEPPKHIRAFVGFDQNGWKNSLIKRPGSEKLSDKEAIVHVVIERDGEKCGEDCPYLVEVLSPPLMARYECSLFGCDLWSGLRAERCLAAERFPEGAIRSKR